MTTLQATLAPPKKTATHDDRPQYLRQISRPLPRGQAARIFAHQQVAETFQRLCA